MLELIPEMTRWYWAAALAYAVLGLQVFLPSTSSLLRQHRLALALTGIAWGAFYAVQPQLGLTAVARTQGAFLVEFSFLLAWFALLYRLLRGPYKQSMPETVRRGLYLYWGLLASVGTAACLLTLDGADYLGTRVLPAVLMAAALACLAMLTQLQRDAPLEDRRVMLAFIAGGILVTGSQAILFGLITLSAPPAPVWNALTRHGCWVRWVCSLLC
jgi:hypothetical protein